MKYIIRIEWIFKEYPIEYFTKRNKAGYCFASFDIDDAKKYSRRKNAENMIDNIKKFNARYYDNIQIIEVED